MKSIVELMVIIRNRKEQWVSVVQKLKKKKRAIHAQLELHVQKLT